MFAEWCLMRHNSSYRYLKISNYIAGVPGAILEKNIWGRCPHQTEELSGERPGGRIEGRGVPSPAD